MAQGPSPSLNGLANRTADRHGVRVERTRPTRTKSHATSSVSKVTASGRSLPASTIGPAPAIELISTWTTTGCVLSHLCRGAVGHLHEIEIRAAIEKLRGKRGCAGRVVETNPASRGRAICRKSRTRF
jgi:hypothetical protein